MSLNFIFSNISSFKLTGRQIWILKLFFPLFKIFTMQDLLQLIRINPSSNLYKSLVRVFYDLF